MASLHRPHRWGRGPCSRVRCGHGDGPEDILLAVSLHTLPQQAHWRRRRGKGHAHPRTLRVLLVLPVAPGIGAPASLCIVPPK